MTYFERDDLSKDEVLQNRELECSSVYLEDILPPGIWNKHRANCDRVANFHSNSEDHKQYANRINLCSQFLDFEVTGDKNEHKLNSYTNTYLNVYVHTNATY